ncbi:MAG: hypothetical protein CGW95_13945 [Phenylobacterium zucineum]|nr:MAG: hypothetical protein CGW95_13945 [Phenylobacterium zucineum]
MDGRYTMALVAFAAFLGVLLLAIRSWKRRAGDQASVIDMPAEGLVGAAPDELFIGHYVSTTPTDEPLERVVAHGLGHRGLASIGVTPAGIIIERRGEADLAILVSQLRGVRREQATIDRVVEADGLVAIDWQLGETALTTNLRIVDGDARAKLFNQINELKEGNK